MSSGCSFFHIYFSITEITFLQEIFKGLITWTSDQMEYLSSDLKIRMKNFMKYSGWNNG